MDKRSRIGRNDPVKRGKIAGFPYLFQQQHMMPEIVVSSAHILNALIDRIVLHFLQFKLMVIRRKTGVFLIDRYKLHYYPVDHDRAYIDKKQIAGA